jgi:drug/metabolite transporter (DMT)-like permease
MIEFEKKYHFSSPIVWLPFLIISIIWGSTWLVIRDQLGVGAAVSVPPGWSVTYRFIVATTGMAVLALVMRQSLSLPRALHPLLVAMGLFQFVLNFNLVYRAEAYLTSGIVAVLFGLLILPNAALARIWLKTPIGRGFIIGSIFACFGAAMLIINEYQRAADIGHVLNPFAVWTGCLFVGAAVLSVSISNVMQASRQFKTQPVVAVVFWAMLYGTAINAVLAYTASGAPVMDWRPSYIGGFTYLALAGSVATFPLYFRLIRQIGPGKAAYSSVLIPIIAMGLSTAFEGYEWSALAIAGGVLSIGGMAYALFAKDNTA